MGLFDNLDPVAGSTLFSDIPEPPGPVESGLKTVGYGIKRSAGGVTALAGRAFGARTLEDIGLDIARRAGEDAAPYARDITQASTPGEIASAVPYAATAGVASLASVLLPGLAGRLVGRLFAGARGASIGTTGGIIGSSAVQSTGGIFPEAVESGVESPVARSLTGGAASAALDTALPLLAAQRLGLFSKAARPSVGGVSGAARGAAIAAPVEAGTEVAQGVIERTAAGQDVTSEEAYRQYVNDAFVGAVGGGIIGGGIGAIKQTPPADAPAPTPSPLDPPPVISPDVPPAPSSPEGVPPGDTSQGLPGLRFPDGAPSDLPIPPLVSEEADRPAPSLLAKFVSPPAPQDLTAELGLRRPVDDLSTLAGPQDGLDARVAAALAESEASPGKVRNEILAPMIAEARTRVDALAAELALPPKSRPDGRTKQAVSKDLKFARAQLARIEAEATRAPAKTSPPSGILLEGGAAPLVDDQLRFFAQETPPFARSAEQVARLQGAQIELPSGVVSEPPVAQEPPALQVEQSNVKSRVVYDNERKAAEESARQAQETADAARKGNVEESDLSQYPNRDETRQASEAGYRNSPLLGGQGEEGIRRADEVARTLRTDLARRKRAAGELLSTDEVGLLRSEGPAPLAAAIEVVPATGRARATLKQGTQRDKIDYFMDTATRAVDTEIASMVQAGVLKDRSSTSIASGAKRAFEASLDSKTVEEAAGKIREGISKVLKGKLKKSDADVFADRVIQAISDAPQVYLSKAAIAPTGARVDAVMKAHLANGGSTTDLTTGASLSGTDNYAVSAHKDREAVVQGQLTPEALAKYIAANTDLLSTKGNVLGTWFNTEDGNTYLDVSQVTPDRARAMEIARSADQLAIFNLKTFETINTEAAPGAGKVRFTHWGNVPGGITDPSKIGMGVTGRDQADAKQFGVNYTSAVVEGADFTEPLVQVRTRYSGELDASKVYDATSYRQDPLFAEAKAKVMAQYGPDFGAAMAQYQKDIVALGYDAIQFAGGQLRIYKPVAVTPDVQHSRASTDRGQAEDLNTRQGRDVVDYLSRVLGGPKDLEVRQFVQRQEGGFAGRYTSTPLKDVIELAYNAKDRMSLAAHEAFHRIETKHLGHGERAIIRRALKKGTPLFNQVLAKARAYDAANGTYTAEEIEAIPQEAHAYGFQMWGQGELKAEGMLESIFRKIRNLLTSVRNYVDGLGFRSVEDVFRAIEAGVYAKNDGPLRVSNMTWLYDGVDDSTFNSKAAVNAASKAPGRPSWVKNPKNVTQMRQRIEGLALEGIQGRNWHAESALAILQWAGYDQRRASTLAALISNYSPRTPVGLDLKKALTAYARWEGANVEVGAPKDHNRTAELILSRQGEVDEAGNQRPSGIKRQNFFRNLMLGIDPERYSAEEQGATIDMWMAHAFGYDNDVAGSISKTEYEYANREVKLLARQLGWQVEETQAAIWVAIKARGNAVRSQMEKLAGSKGWYEIVDKGAAVESDLFGDYSTGQRVVKKEHQADFVKAWMDLALSVKPSYEQYQKANYNYATAFRDLRAGKIELAEGVPFVVDADPSQDTQGDAPQLTLFSRASLTELSTRAANGEVETTQLMAAVADAVDKANIPEPTYKQVFGAVGQGMLGSLKRGYLSNFSSGMNLARNSVGFKNVFGVLTAHRQRRDSLIADGVEQKLSQWLTAPTKDLEAAGLALMDRTSQDLKVGTPEYQTLMQRLTPEQRALFDQATAMVADRLNLEFVADQRAYGRALGAETPAYKEWFERRSQQVADMIASGYVPERRYGDHIVHISQMVGDKKVTVYSEQYETEAAAILARDRYTDALQSVAPELAVRYDERYSPEYDGTGGLDQFLDTARRFGIEVSQAEKERLAKAMVAADSVKRNRIFRRKNVPGYSTDATRVLAEFGVAMANKVAYSEFSEAIGEAQKGTKVDVGWNNGAATLEIVPETNLWRQDGSSAGYYRNLADRTIDFTLTPEKGGAWSRATRAAASLHFLGGSFAAGIVNLSSLPMVAAPYLSIHTGYTNALAKLGKAFTTTTANSGVLTNLEKLDDRQNAIPAVDSVPGLRDALVRAGQDGTTLDTEIHQIMGLTKGGLLAKSRNVRRSLDAWMYPFRKTEQWNRISTFIAAYNVGVENSLGGNQLYEFAQKAVYDTQNRYDEANRPGAARNPVWAVMFTFKSFPIFMTEAVVALYREKPAAAGVMLLSLAFFAGLQGLPFAEDIMDVVDTVAQRVFKSPFNSQRALKNAMKAASEAVVGADLSGVLLRGVVNEITGMSIASRVGLGNLIPGTRFGTADADYKRTVEEVIGPAASMAGGLFDGAVSMLKGDATGAVKAAAPLAIQNGIKGWQQWDKGYSTDAGGRMLAKASGFEAILQAAGFSSGGLAHLYDLDRIDRQTTAFYNLAREDFSKAIVKAIRDGDTERVTELTQAITAWNTTHPEMPLAISGSSIRRRIAEAGMPLNERTLRHLPRAMRSGSEALGVTLDNSP